MFIWWIPSVPLLDPYRGWIVEATVEISGFLEIFGLILIKFDGFQAILMVLVIWAMFFNSEWYRNHVRIWSGDRLLTLLRAIICARTFVACKYYF